MSIPTDKERGAPLTASLITIHKVPRLIVDYELRIPPKDKNHRSSKDESPCTRFPKGFRGQEKQTIRQEAEVRYSTEDTQKSTNFP